MSEVVSYRTEEGVAVIEIDSPPVNALGQAVRAGLADALGRAGGDAGVKAVVIAGAGKVFSAGADITEFGKPPKDPPLSQVCSLCESMDKPVVAAIRGLAFGGGFELALACHARIAAPDAKIGQPEVKLGLIPGGGATQRLPRLTGPVAALDIIVTGNPVSAEKAVELGALDEIVEGNFLDGAIGYARKLASDGKLPAPARDRDGKLAAVRADRSAFDARAEALTRKARGLDAPHACVRAVRMTLDTPFDEGLAKERDIFRELVNGVQSRAQRHLFFAERQAAKVDAIGRDVKPRDVRKVAVIGAGTMGGGIAMSFLNGAIPVTILEMNAEALDRGLGAIRRNYDGSVGRGSITSEERDRRLGLLKGTTSYDDLADADLVIEAVFEEMAIKKEVFQTLDRIVRPGAVLASNTSYLDIDEIAAVTKRPSDVVGMHFFSPANVMKLLEIVRGRQTAPEVLAAALAVGKRIAKVPVVVGVCHGFVGNRMLNARSAENEDLLLEGAAPEAVDRAFTDFGFPMGPFAMGDLAGLDIGWRNRKSLGKTAAIADALCEQGRYGQKTGKGFYLYEQGSRKPVPDPEVAELIRAQAERLGVRRREISAAEIIERTIYPMVNEGARILEEGIAARSSDIDVVWVNGYGFPVGKGGPMFWADQEGLKQICERLEHWHLETGKPVFEPAPLLRRLADEGGTFAGLDAERGRAA